MKRVLFSLAGLVAGLAALAAAAPAAAQASGSSGTETLGNPHDIGMLATTPSRIASSRREMNRDRATPFEVRMSRRQTRRYAAELIRRADIRCDIEDALVVARTRDFIPVIEVDCVEGGGLVIADTLPIQATDCLDFLPVEGAPARPGAFEACRLPANVASVAAARQLAGN